VNTGGGGFTLLNSHIWEGILWLEGFLGFEPRVAVTVSICATVDKHFGEVAVPEGECGPCPVFASICLRLPYN
jgi:hypothetical protein